MTRPPFFMIVGMNIGNILGAVVLAVGGIKPSMWTLTWWSIAAIALMVIVAIRALKAS